MFILFFTSIFFQHYAAFFINIDAHGEECFHDKVDPGTRMALMFEVADGGFLDIDVKGNYPGINRRAAPAENDFCFRTKIIGPDQKVIYKGERETSGKYTFAAHMEGTYYYCFSNKMSTMTPKIVKFNMDIGDPPKDTSKEDAEHHDKLNDMIQQLTVSLAGVKQEQEYMEVRDRVHRAINDSTNSRVVWWAFFESLILVCMTLGQVYYLKRFFEVRRVI